jgi:stage V sporulation protein AD
MGAAMAPAARNTLLDFLSNDGHSVDYFDLIVTGDLGYEGSEILKDLLMRDGVDIYDRHTDCGLLIFDRERQDKHAGGSGCGCSASVLSAKILRDMENGVLNNILFIGTGALMNPLTLYQGNSIPSIAHLVHLSTE